MSEPRIIRVFPRKTKASPDDALAYFGRPDLFAEADEVHVSVAFTQDRAIAERLAEEWKYVAPVKVGGPAYEKEQPYRSVHGLWLNRHCRAAAGYAFCGRRD